MNTFNLIVRLKKSYHAFHKEVTFAKDPEYVRFLSRINFFTFIEYVIQSSIIYPRSIDECRSCVSDLAYGFANNLGVGVFDISDEDYEQLAKLVTLSSEEVISAMDGVGYYIDPSKFTKHLSMEDEYHFISDLSANCIVTKLGDCSFRVIIKEGEYPEINEDLIQHSVFDYRCLL